MSSNFFRPRSLLAISALVLSTLAVAACSNDGPPSATGAPVPGDFGTAPASTGDSSELPGPRADTPKDRPRPSKMKKTGPEEPKKPVDPAKMDETTFVPKAYCLMPKLSMCSVYGSLYERLSSVSQFCAALGGEQAASCPTESRVARCITTANVITSYYSSGEKPYTKESAEAKCTEKEWKVLSN